MADPFDLNRFARAQASVYDTALAELRAGRKRSHWMWFIFPQLEALGRSATAKCYGIKSLGEAAAYLDHNVLGPRLVECTQIALAATAPSLVDYLGTPDNLKFRSSMTLFCLVDRHPDSPFRLAIEKWCTGGLYQGTIDLLNG